MSRRRSRHEETAIKWWMVTTPTRTDYVASHDLETAQAIFQEKYGYWPDVNQMEPVLEPRLG